MIVPAILTDNKDKFRKMLELTKKFAPYVQIDIMDGEFVPSRSITVEELENFRSPLPSEAHLMVNDPLVWVEPFKQFGAKRIIFHYEIDKNKKELIDYIRDKDLSVGLAVNPSTEIEKIEELVNSVDMILFMSVEPGFYGSKFIPQVLDKIKQFRERYNNKSIGIDGGIKLDNVKLVKQLGIDYICVGSAIFKQSSPQEAYEQFNSLINE